MTQNLYEKLTFLAEYSGRSALPDYIRAGLPAELELRPYQVNAIGDFITYFESPRLRQKPAQTLFHMATGSGKTLIMAALMLYLYEQGYRNFLFFVNSTNVLDKTIDNFVNTSSRKYLFNDAIKVGGRTIEVNRIDNFQSNLPDAINILFTTIQALHSDLSAPREGRLSHEDFDERKTVLISDEAHHTNSITKQRLTLSEADRERSWESTVSGVLARNDDNVLLEFTATCDLGNDAIAAKYGELIVADYPLSRFRQDGYSKEIQLLQSDLEPIQRILQAFVISQYRLKLFEKHGLAIKPVVMIKSKTISANKLMQVALNDLISNLEVSDLELIRGLSKARVTDRAFKYFSNEGIDLRALVAEIKVEFEESRCLAIDSERVSPQVQITVNSLESPKNPIRCVLAVDMLNEGWDVLNLFDIVRTYDTRDSTASKPGKTTMQEAQLIGRGARYCPFRITTDQDTFRRKYDDDLDNELRVCEELYFHSATNSKYIDDLRKALREIGAISKNGVEIEYKIKESFRDSDLYKTGNVFLNTRNERTSQAHEGLPEFLRVRQVFHQFASGASQESGAFTEQIASSTADAISTTRTMSEIPQSILSASLRQCELLRFDLLKRKLPTLKSSIEFLTDEDYLGGVRLTLVTAGSSPTAEEWFQATTELLATLAPDIQKLDYEYYGSKEFAAQPLRAVITDRRRVFDDPKGDGEGIAQSKASSEYRLNTLKLEWFAQEEHYGTTEEKRFLIYFSTFIEKLEESYESVTLIRNERQVAIYDFESGDRFEPDFLLFLRRPKGIGFEQFQVFVEPKGTHLLELDRWKERLLLRLKKEAIVTKTFVDDNEYHVWGLPFYNHENSEQFKQFANEAEANFGPSS